MVKKNNLSAERHLRSRKKQQDKYVLIRNQISNQYPGLGWTGELSPNIEKQRGFFFFFFSIFFLMDFLKKSDFLSFFLNVFGFFDRFLIQFFLKGFLCLFCCCFYGFFSKRPRLQRRAAPRFQQKDKMFFYKILLEQKCWIFNRPGVAGAVL